MRPSSGKVWSSSPAIKDTLSPLSRLSLSPTRNLFNSRKTKSLNKGVNVSKYGGGRGIIDDVIPVGARGMSNESLIRFLQAKVKMLHQELTSTQQDYIKKTEDCRRSQISIKQAEDEKGKALHELSITRDKMKKQAVQIVALQNKLQLRDSENTILRREVEALRQDIKKLTVSSSGNEVKLNSSREEIDKLKQELKKKELKEKEMREKNRVQMDELISSVRGLEKQKSALNSAFKKQMALINNLRNQKAYLEANKLVKKTETQFTKLLDWRPEGYEGDREYYDDSGACNSDAMADLKTVS